MKYWKRLCAVILAGCMLSFAAFADEPEKEFLDGEGMEKEVPFADTMISLYLTLSEENPDFMYSPYSLKDAFAILYPAADGDSKAQLEHVFGFTGSSAEALSSMDRAMVFRKGNGVKAANRAFINKRAFDGGELHPEVLGDAAVDITRFGAGTAGYINRWIAGQTNNKIRNLIPKEAVSADTRAVLVNCLYFLMNWDAEPWHITFGENTIPSFTDTTGLMNIREEGDIDILRLPYKKLDEKDENEHRYAMYILCDNAESEEDKVDSFMRGLTDKKLLELLDFSGYEGLSGYTHADYNVPCFEMENTFPLKEKLLSLGLTAPFMTGTEDFKRFGPVYVDDVLQGTFIRCDDKGTEAAAATAIIMELTSAVIEPPKVWKHVVADSTFAFAIRDETSGEILFMGRVSDPKYTKAGE